MKKLCVVLSIACVGSVKAVAPDTLALWHQLKPVSNELNFHAQQTGTIKNEPLALHVPPADDHAEPIAQAPAPTAAPAPNGKKPASVVRILVAQLSTLFGG